MAIHNLNNPSKPFSEKEEKELNYLNNLIRELNNREIPDSLAQKINAKIVSLNNLDGSRKAYIKALKATQQDILKWLEKELKLMSEKYYSNRWSTLGMLVFGLSIGTAMFAITGNSAFIAVGFPIGLGIGSLYGASLDKKAEAEGRVLKFSE